MGKEQESAEFDTVDYYYYDSKLERRKLGRGGSRIGVLFRGAPGFICFLFFLLEICFSSFVLTFFNQSLLAALAVSLFYLCARCLSVTSSSIQPALGKKSFI